jgi:hypothetical protein
LKLGSLISGNLFHHGAAKYTKITPFLEIGWTEDVYRWQKLNWEEAFSNF